MKLLDAFILSLTDQEASKLRLLKLGQKQQKVLLHVLNSRNKVRNNTIPSIPQGYTSSHYYEICSVILRRCYGVFGKSADEQLEFLQTKNLNIHFKRELKRREAELPLKKGRDSELLYFAAFELLHRFSHNLIDWQLIDYCKKKYLAAKKNPTDQDKIMMEVRSILGKLVTIVNDGKEEHHESKALFVKLKECEAKLTPSSDPFFHACVYSALAWYWRYFGSDNKNFLYYCKSAIPYTDKLKGKIFRESPIAMRLRLGEAYFVAGSDKEAADVLEDAIAHLAPGNTLWKRYFYLFPSIEILLFGGKYDLCEEILCAHFEPMFDQQPTTAATSGAALFTKLYLLKKDYPKAKKYLNIAISLNTKTNFTLRSELQNRFLEAAYFFLTGDLEYADTICKRARHFLVVRKMGLNNYLFGWYFKYIELLIDRIERGKLLSIEAQEKFLLLTSRKEIIIGKLLQEIHLMAVEQ